MKPTSIQNGWQINEQKRVRWKMMHKSFNILQNSTPNQPKWCPGALPKATSQASRRNVGHIFETNVTIFEKCSSLAAILGFSWAPGGFQNQFFGTKSSQNLKKWAPEWGIRTNMKFWLNFNVKNSDFECAEPTGMLYIKAFRWLALIMTKSRNS